MISKDTINIDRGYEEMTRWAYLDKEDKAFDKAKEDAKNKYQLEMSVPKKGTYGFSMTIFEPINKSSESLYPYKIFAFRGTEPLKWNDWLTDLSGAAPGKLQFDWNRYKSPPKTGENQNKDDQDNDSEIWKIIKGESNLVFIGHSLGGALAQYFGISAMERIRSIVTFQSPGIDAFSAASAYQFHNLNPGVPISRHYRAYEDFVHNAGDAFTPGLLINIYAKNYGKLLEDEWQLIRSLEVHGSLLLGLKKDNGNEIFSTNFYYGHSIYRPIEEMRRSILPAIAFALAIAAIRVIISILKGSIIIVIIESIRMVIDTLDAINDTISNKLIRYSQELDLLPYSVRVLLLELLFYVPVDPIEEFLIGSNKIQAIKILIQTVPYLEIPTLKKRVNILLKTCIFITDQQKEEIEKQLESL